MSGALSVAVRTDRLGDLLLSLPPILEYQKTVGKMALVTSETLAEFARHCVQGFEIEVVARKNFKSLLPRASHCIFLNQDSKLLFQAALHGIQNRIGNYSKIDSFLLLTNGIAQKRSNSKKNEGEYCFDLLQLVAESQGIAIKQNDIKLTIPIHAVGRREADTVLKKVAADYIVIHPGMGGSALNCSPEFYAGMVEKFLENDEFQIVFSFGDGKQDALYKKYLTEAFPNVPVISGLSLFGLMELLRGAKWVLAPSTGPLHLAHCVGAPTIGLYSPVLTHHPRRWQPRGGTGHSRILVPDVECPATRHCLKEKCKEYNCMDKSFAAL